MRTSVRIFFLAVWLAAGSAWAETATVLCLGDSLTEGYGLEPEDAWPALAQKMLRDRGHDVRLVNAGVSGSTAASGPGRLAWQLRSNPVVVVLELGANDGLRGLDLTQTREHLAKTIGAAKAHGARVLLAGMKIPLNYGRDYTERFAELFPRLAEEHGTALIPFFLEGVAGRSDLNLADGIHPNAAGHRVVAETVVRHLEPLLSAERHGRNRPSFDVASAGSLPSERVEARSSP